LDGCAQQPIPPHGWLFSLSLWAANSPPIRRRPGRDRVLRRASGGVVLRLRVEKRRIFQKLSKFFSSEKACFIRENGRNAECLKKVEKYLKEVASNRRIYDKAKCRNLSE